MRVHRCAFAIALFCSVSAVHVSLAQPPAPPAEPPAAAPDAAPRRENEPLPLPVAPETTIIGRPGDFPSQPLPEGTVVAPTLTSTPVAEVGSAITVITAAEIAATQRTQVADVLRDVPGVDVAQSGGMGGQTSVFLRGANSAQTKVLLDGIPLNDPSSATGGVDFSTISVDNIQQIEVLRGPQSGLYGSDAMGGVINIITKRGDGPTQGRVEVNGGTYGTARESLSVNGGGKEAYYSFAGSYLQSDGFPPLAGGQAPAPVFHGALGGRVGWTPDSDFDLDYVYRYVSLDTAVLEFDPITFQPVDHTHPYHTTSFVNRIQARKATTDGFWEQKAGFSVIEYDRVDTNPGPFVPGQYLGQALKVDYQSNFALAEWTTFSAGADYLDQAASDTFDPRTSFNDKGVWFGEQFRIAERWFTTASFRWDEISTAGNASTYRLTTRYITPEIETAFHGSIGTGFRAPSLAETLFPFGNPNLLPEHSFGWDAGVEQPFADGQFTVDGTYFYNRYTDLIQFDFFRFMVENIGHATTSGTELTARWKINDLTTLSGNYTYTFTEDLDTGLPLVRRAPHKMNLTLNRQVWDGRGNVLLNVRYVSPRTDVGSTELAEYWLVNTAATYDLTPHVQLMARIDNLFNKQYQEAFGYAMPGISFYGGAGVHW